MTRFQTGIVGAALMLALAACGRPAAPDEDEGAAEALQDLFERHWEWRLEADPLWATSVGDHRYDDRLPERSPDALREFDERRAERLAELADIDRDALSAADGISYDMFERTLTERREEYRFGGHLMPLTADSGFHTALALAPQQMRFASVADFETYLSRLAAVPRYVDQNIALMREGLRGGMTVPRVALAGVEDTIAALAVEDPTASPFWTPFEAMPAAFPARDRDRLLAEGRRVIQDVASPAYGRFLRFMTGEYLPGARETLGASALPNGTDYYRFLVRKFTTLDVSPDEVHGIGLEQVAALQQEMEAAMRAAGFTGTLQEFFTFLRSDPRFYPKTEEELLKEASYIAKRMDAALPRLFGRLPRQPYGVAPVPDYLAPKYTAGRYNGHPPGGTEAGYYWVNTYALETRPLYNLEALTLHEAVPGHHLQIALAYELDDLPAFRRWMYLSAFGEGWGLYAEWLGLEAGFYTDPYSNFGRLTYAMWRAARLVVDTGLHVKGWTRQQAIDYLAEHTALSLHECTTETDRYISWPAQALSYKMGELKIRELRRRAEQALGAGFDVRRFHDAVLGNGAIPLTVLEDAIDRFIEAETERAKRAS